MKGKQLMFVLVLLIVSCKVKEETITGKYFDKKNFSKLTLNKDHSFLYYGFDHLKLLQKYDLDSCHFITRGEWKLTNNELVLNSFGENYSDTSRLRNISIVPSGLEKSKFSFKGVYGETIDFGSASKYIYDRNETEFHSIDDGSFTKIDMKVSPNDILVFNFWYYKPLKITVQDSINADYSITIAPYYKQAYFINKKFIVNSSRIKDNRLKLKKDKVTKNK